MGMGKHNQSTMNQSTITINIGSIHSPWTIRRTFVCGLLSKIDDHGLKHLIDGGCKQLWDIKCAADWRWPNDLAKQ